MTCANTATSAGDKGVGTRFFFDPDSCTHVVDPDADPLVADPATSNDYTELVCTQDVTPPGVERAEEEDDGCLAEDNIITGVGPRKFTSSTVTFRWNPGSALDIAIRAAEKAGETRSFVIKHPVAATFVYQWFDAIISQFQPQQVTKRGFRTATIRLTPSTEAVIETTATDLGTGLT